MQLVIKLPLEHIALIKTVVTLWNRNDVRARIENFSALLRHINPVKEWQTIENKVIENVRQLPLPVLLKEKLIGIIKPIGFEILKWMEYHLACYSFHVNLPSKFCWTSQGMIDWKKTAKVLITEKIIDSPQCYQLVRVYCLEDDIPQFWNEIPKNISECFFYEDCHGYYSEKNISFAWACILKEESDGKFCSSYGGREFYKMFANKVTAEYFLDKLSAQERQASLISIAKHVQDAEVVYFLLLQMNEEQQMEVYKNKPYQVLRSFLDWPFQILFTEIANHVWDFLPESHCYLLLTKMITKVLQCYKDWDYQNLFGRFWKKTSQSIKSNIIGECGSLILSSLLSLKDEKNLKLVLKDASSTEKNALIYSDRVLDSCRILILVEDWNLLNCIIQECLSSEDEMITFKKKFEKHLRKDHFPITKHKWQWNKIFCLSHDSDFIWNKGEGTCSM